MVVTCKPELTFCAVPNHPKLRLGANYGYVILRIQARTLWPGWVGLGIVSPGGWT
jgi:hypothetical protein